MAQADVVETLNLVGGEAADLVSELRSVLVGGLPSRHAHLVRSAVVHLEAVQRELFQVIHDPWGSSTPGSERQLHLL